MSAALPLVVMSGMLHAYWNYLAKRSLNKHAFLWHAQWIAVAVYAPFAAAESFRGAWPAGALPYALGSMFLHGIYIWLLAKAYTLGDLSRVYPILRGTAPLVVPAAAVLVLGEPLSSLGWAGVVLIVGGIASLSGSHSVPGCEREAGSGKAVMLALVIGMIVSGYILWDKIALSRGVPPLTLNALSNVGNGLALTAAAVRSGAWRTEWRVNRGRLLLAGTAASGGYSLFLLAVPLMPIAQLAPLREIGTVFGTAFGIFLLHEPAGWRRMSATVVITAGIILLSVSR
jgi:drug/metabolite transporter (DMT)-like permease